MAIRKKTEETFVVEGDRQIWFERTRRALDDGGFTAIREQAELWQLQARYRKLTIWGWIDVTLTPAAEGSTQLAVAVTSNVDNIYALFRSPGRRIMDVFKDALLPPADRV